jgi:hypothetical protein
MRDLADVSKEVVATSFSSSNFGKAIECWQVLREQALLVWAQAASDPLVRDNR